MKRKYASNDFISSMLPTNRRAQFFDILKTRFSVLSKIFLISFLFSLPIFIIFSIKYFFIIGNAALVMDTNDEAYVNFLRLNNIIFYLVDTLGYLILSIGYSGIFNLYKKIIWAEPIFFFSDFKNGIKQNWKCFVVGTLFISIFRFAVNTFVILSGYHYISYIFTTIFLLILPVFFIGFSLYSIYDTKIFEAYKKSSSFYFRKIGYYFIFLLYALIVILAKYFVEEYFGMAVLGFLLCFINLTVILPLFLLIFSLYNFSLFDLFTNQKYFPEYYHRGLFDSSSYSDTIKLENTFLFKQKSTM